ncbi:glycosyltransferase [Terriglobus saanensis]|uniref:Glycosyl transferase group 1 n=1 Tax=Terriglobus saanensis (strain ATCC BAA-1853 / DSM 23119 / SP1PR4) TaxID=401053 RepID=E8V6Z1_TERSS|nr:glycosyltransferase [Terriglobus saanensis]ADV85015.1 glycosyl transferase group 1 [Terriglobus saanensis SP1PR4]
MSNQSSSRSVRAAIACEAINGGGLAHYTEDLDRIMRTYAAESQVLEGHPYVSPLRGQGSSSRKAKLWLLEKLPLLRRVFERIRRQSRTQDPWPHAAAWASLWRNRSSDIIAIVPHVVIHDEGRLDDYYAAIAERPFVLVIHDLHALHFPQEWKPRDVETLKSRFALLGKAAKQIIVHNEFTADDVVDKLGIERDRITVVLLPAFFDEVSFRASPEADAARLEKLDIRKPYALWASSSTFVHKNHPRLTKAWRLLADRGHTLQLVCTGTRAPHWNEVEDLIQTENLESLVRFTGVIDDAALAAVMRNAHLAVCPTLFEGGGPGPAAEAALAGIPLTLSSIPQCRELFNLRTDLCTFFDPYDPKSIADAVEDLFLNYEEAKDRAALAKEQYPRLRTQQSAAERYWHAVLAAQKN